MRFDDMIASRRKHDEKIRLVAENFQKYERRLQIVGFAVAIPLIAIFALLLWQVVTASTSIGALATESESVIRANERLLEMIKWTISTLLIGGGALIGLSWYMSEARHNLDRALAEQERIDYQINLESAMSIAIGQVEDDMDEIREYFLELQEAPEGIYDYTTGEFTFLESDADEEESGTDDS